MNIIQIQDRLKGVPDSALIGYVENPNSDIPTYLALGELQRRKTMRDRYEAQQEPASTVSEQIVEESKPKGLDAIAAMGQSTAPTAVESQGLEGMQAPNMESFANGGVVAFAQGDYIDPYAEYRLDVPDYAKQRMEEYKGFLGVDPNRAKLDERLAKLEERAGRREAMAPGLAMMQAGLGIAAGTSPYALQNIGQGAQAGVEMYGKEMANIDDLRAKQYQLEAEKAKMERAEDIAIANKGADSAEAARAQNLKVGLQTEQDKLAREEMASKERIAETSASAYRNMLAGNRLDLAVNEKVRSAVEKEFGPKQKMLESYELAESMGNLSPENQLKLNALRAEKQKLIDRFNKEYSQFTTAGEPKTEQTPKTGGDIVDVPGKGKFRKLPNGNYVQV